MVLHFTSWKLNVRGKAFSRFYGVENFDCRENQTKNNLFSIYPSMYFTNSYYLPDTLLGAMGKRWKAIMYNYKLCGTFKWMCPRPVAINAEMTQTVKTQPQIGFN